MNNLPKIHATCAAGCLWETVHRSEFERAATYAPIRLDSGATRVDPWHKYKIKTNIVDGAYACTVKILVNNNDDSVEISEPYELDIPITKAFDKYRDHFYIEVLAWDYVSEETYNLIYELNGEQQTFGYTTTEDLTLGGILIANATEVYRYNADAEILAKDGITPHIGANGNWFIGDIDTGVKAGGNGGGGEYEIPTFDLVALGLPTIIPNGQYVRVAIDTTEIIAALEKGAVKIIVNFNMGAEVVVSLVLNPASVIATGEYSCTITNEFNNTVLITTVGVGNGYIAAKCTPMDNIIGAYINIALGGDY